MSNYRKNVVAEYAEKIKSHGFRVFMAASGEYGIFTNDDGSRVASFQYDLCGAIAVSGNYVPAKGCGSGWRIGEFSLEYFTKENTERLLNGGCPRWANPNPTWQTLESHLAQYGKSSGYVEMTEGGIA